VLWEGTDVQIMGFNRWDTEVPNKALVELALKFAETMKARGIARLRGAWIASDQNLMWCLWDTKDVEPLQDAFDEMNRQSGLVTELASVEKFFPK
jgi:hypothetical protein